VPECYLCARTNLLPMSPDCTDVMSNNALERQRTSSGRAVLAMDCVLAGAEWAAWWAAQQDR